MDIALDSLYQGIDFDFSLNLIGICDKFFQKYINFLNQSLHQANLEKKDINNIIIYGELSPIFELKEMIYKYFDGIQIMKGISSMEIITYGATIATTYFQKIEEFNENNTRLIQKIHEIQKMISNERNQKKLKTTKPLMSNNFFDLLENKIINLEREINNFEIEQKNNDEDEKEEIIEENNKKIEKINKEKEEIEIEYKKLIKANKELNRNYINVLEDFKKIKEKMRKNENKFK